MNPHVIIRKDVREVKTGDRFQHESGVREVVRVIRREVVFPNLGGKLERMPGCEILHRAPWPATPKPAYLCLPEGAQLPVVVS